MKQTFCPKPNLCLETSRFEAGEKSAGPAQRRDLPVQRLHWRGHGQAPRNDRGGGEHAVFPMAQRTKRSKRQ